MKNTIKYIFAVFSELFHSTRHRKMLGVFLLFLASLGSVSMAKPAEALTLTSTSNCTTSSDISCTYTPSLSATHAATIVTDKSSYSPGENVVISSTSTGSGYYNSEVTQAWFYSGGMGSGVSVYCTAGWNGGVSGNCGSLWFLNTIVPYFSSNPAIPLGSNSVTVAAPASAGTYSLPITLTTRLSCTGNTSGGCASNASGKAPVFASGVLSITVVAGGTINVSSDIAGASWTITGPATLTGSGASASYLSRPTGTYTITWNPVSGYTTPPSASQTLTSGGTLSFSGNYLTPSVNIFFSHLMQKLRGVFAEHAFAGEVLR